MTFPALNNVDFALIAIVLLSAVVGLLRGVVREVISAAAWVLGIWAAANYGSAVTPYIARYVASTALQLWLGRLAIVVLVLIAGALLGFAARLLMRGSGLSGLDRLLGMVFGVVRGGLILAAIIWSLRVAGLDHEPWWRESKLIPYATPAMDQLRALI